MSRMKNSVRMTFAMIAPTKNPSSRLKITPQASQSCLRLNGRLTIDAFPHTGHCNFKERHRTSPIVRASRFISRLHRAHRPPLGDVRAAELYVMRLDCRRGLWDVVMVGRLPQLDCQIFAITAEHIS